MRAPFVSTSLCMFGWQQYWAKGCLSRGGKNYLGNNKGELNQDLFVWFNHLLKILGNMWPTCCLIIVYWVFHHDFTRGSHLYVLGRSVCYQDQIESNDQSPFWGPSRDQGDLQAVKINRSRMHWLQFDVWPWKSSNQEAQKGTIKRSSTLTANLIAVANASTGNMQVTTPCLSHSELPSGVQQLTINHFT